MAPLPMEVAMTGAIGVRMTAIPSAWPSLIQADDIGAIVACPLVGSLDATWAPAGRFRSSLSTASIADYIGSERLLSVLA